MGKWPFMAFWMHLVYLKFTWFTSTHCCEEKMFRSSHLEDGEFGAHGARCLRGGSWKRSTPTMKRGGNKNPLWHHYDLFFFFLNRISHISPFVWIFWIPGGSYTQCEFDDLMIWWFDDRRCHWILSFRQVEFCKALLATQNTCYIPCGSPKQRSTDVYSRHGDFY